MSEHSPLVAVQQLITSHTVARCVQVVAELGVADQIGDVPVPVEEIARAVDAHSGALDRVLRLLAVRGMFVRVGVAYAHSPLSLYLCRDHPQSLRPFARMAGMKVMWRSYESFEQVVRSGTADIDEFAPGGFAWFAAHPREGAIFDEAMASMARVHIGAVMSSYDFSAFAAVADIGGGRGHLLETILAAVPGSTGILFDLPHVIESARGIASARLKLQAGDFFTASLPACDCYLLMNVIQDWDDEQAARILRAVRQAAPAHATVLIVEAIVSDDPRADFVKLQDVHMLTVNGRQRTCGEHAALFGRSGLRLMREIPTSGGVSLVEAVVT
jgi:hypothetical protein